MYTAQSGTRQEPQNPINLPPMPDAPAPKTGGGGAAIFGLILALGACSGMAFVYLEPIMAYDRLVAGVYGKVEPIELHYRLREAGIPLIASSGGGLLAFFLGMAGKGRGAGKVAIFFALAALGAAGYVWARYGEGIIRAL